jgi:3-dehydroquinate dehydratase/shikimate dehydrogenase
MSEARARVCAVIAEESIEAARAAIKRAAEVADMVELRLDYLRDFDFSRTENLKLLLEDKPLPAIITCRAVDEGGCQHVETSARLRLLVEGARQVADYCDVEAAYYDQAMQLSPDPSRLIVSYHNFAETPADLHAVYRRLCSLPAAIHKIATRARSVSDALSLFRLLECARAERRRLVALAMGEPGFITRVLGPAWGSFLTYGSVASGRESAPGQASCEELKRSYRIQELSRNTAVTGIIGQPVSQSASPAMHNAAFSALGLDFVYLPIEVSDLVEFFERFIRSESREMDWRLRGLSVTIPHKTAVMRLLDEIDPVARSAGAVNTVLVEGDRLVGYNTDVQGAIAPLERICALSGTSCAVIGAGGAARAVVYGLVERGARVTIFARDPAKACALGDNFGAAVLPLGALESSNAQVVINATPVGMRWHSEGHSPIPREALRGRHVAYDLVYNPIDTRFLKDARAQGCKTISGIEMLIAQAALQFELWTGKKPPLALMREAALRKLALDQLAGDGLNHR